MFGGKRKNKTLFGGKSDDKLQEEINKQEKIADHFIQNGEDVPESVSRVLSDLKGKLNPNKKILGAQKVMYKDREFDSRSERDFCKWLCEELKLNMDGLHGAKEEDADFHTQVEVELQPAFTLIDGEKIRSINMVPDFFIRPRNCNIQGVFVDIKGYTESSTVQHFRDKWKMLKYKFKEEDYDYFCPSSKDEIDVVKKKIKLILIEGGWQAE